MIMAVSLVFTTSCSQKEPQLGVDPVKKVIEAMTLEEKAMLLVGTGMFIEIPDSILNTMSQGPGGPGGSGSGGHGGTAGSAGPEGFNPFMPGQGVQVDSAYKAMVDRIRKFVPGASGRTAEIPRLGISDNGTG